MKFIDLFAGLGGFHLALEGLGHECVFASEINENLRELYKKNWGIEPYGDIRKIVNENIELIPKHDILCAGFPCQPFSKAGKQEGRNDKIHGTLFEEIVKILSYRKPRYFILENVPFIAKHDNEATWDYMKRELENLNYKVDYKNYSPHDFGIPQHRLRIFIVGAQKGLTHFNFDEIDKRKNGLVEIKDFIGSYVNDSKKLSRRNIECLNLWQKFIESIPKNVKIPGFPIWAMEFGATYPFDKKYPARLSANELKKFRGNFGISLNIKDKEKQLLRLPSYARVDKEFPDWKKKYIEYNRKFYSDNKIFVKNIVAKISQYESQSWQKLEWNVQIGRAHV